MIGSCPLHWASDISMLQITSIVRWICGSTYVPPIFLHIVLLTSSVQERNLHYVVYIEVFLAKAFNFTPSDDHEDLLSFDGIVPPHFYGVMAKTDEGCQVLQEKGHFSEFAAFIRRHGLESEDQDLILKLKSVLWAVVRISYLHVYDLFTQLARFVGQHWRK